MSEHDKTLQALSEASSALWKKINDVAVARAELEKVRGNRGANPDAVMDAASAFRRIERELTDALGKVVDVQAKVLGLTPP